MKVLNFEQGECNKIRTDLDSYITDEVLVETNHEVLKHLENCKDCSAALASESAPAVSCAGVRAPRAAFAR